MEVIGFLMRYIFMCLESHSHHVHDILQLSDEGFLGRYGYPKNMMDTCAGEDINWLLYNYVSALEGYAGHQVSFEGERYFLDEDLRMGRFFFATYMDEEATPYHPGRLGTIWVEYIYP